MGACEFHYPNESSPTANFVPEHQPVSPGSGVGFLSGVAADLMSDAVTMYRYQIADSVMDFELKWSVWTDTDYANFFTFMGAVGSNGFRMKAPITLGTYYDVAFTSDNYSRIDIHSIAPGLWTATLKLRRITGS